MAEWDENSRDMADFAEHDERPSADYLAQSDLAQQQIPSHAKDPSSQPYPSMEEEYQPHGTDAFAQHTSHSSQDEYLHSQVVPDVDQQGGDSLDHHHHQFESEPQNPSSLHGDATDVPANFSREPAKNEQFQMGADDDDHYEHHGDQTGHDQYRDQTGDQYRDQTDDQYRDQTEDQYRDQTEDQYRDQIGHDQYRDQTEDQYRDQTGDQHRDQTDDQYMGQNEDQYRDQHGDQYRDQTGDQYRGQTGDDEYGDQYRVQTGDQYRDEIGAQTGASDEGFGQIDHHHQQAEGSNPFDAADALPAQRDAPNAEEERPIYSNPFIMDKEDEAYSAQQYRGNEASYDDDVTTEVKGDEAAYGSGGDQATNEFKGDDHPREPMEERHDELVSETMAGTMAPPRDERFEDLHDGNDDNENDVDDEEEEEESVTENTADHFQYGKMEEEDATEELPEDESDSREVPVIGIDNQAFTDQDEGAKDDHVDQGSGDNVEMLEARKEEEVVVHHHEEMEHEEHHQSETFAPSQAAAAAAGFDEESPMATTTTGYGMTEDDRPEEHHAPSQFDARADDTGLEGNDVVEGHHDTDAEKYPNNEFDMAKVPEISVCEPCGEDDDDDMEQQVPDERDLGEDHFTSDDHAREQSPVIIEPSQQQTPHEFQSDMEEHHEHTGQDSIHDFSQQGEFQESSRIETTQSEPVRYDQGVGEEDRFDRREESEQFEHQEQQHNRYEDEEREEKPYSEERFVEDVIESASAGSQFTQPPAAYTEDDRVDDVPTHLDASDINVEKQDEETAKESNTHEEENNFETMNNYNQEERELSPRAQDFSQHTEREDESHHNDNMHASSEETCEEERRRTDAYNEGLGSSYQQQHLDSEEEDERDQSVNQGQENAPPPSYIGDLDSVMSSREEKQSFVDNLDELASPETIPQPLPSPPEPRNISNFDPLVPDSSPARSPSLENHEAYGHTDGHGEPLDRNEQAEEAADFLTAGEVEGETKFGVDGSAITKSASQNNQFLTSEEEDESPQMEYEYAKTDEYAKADELATATTTETNTETETTEASEKSGDLDSNSVDPGAFEQFEAGHDNALMTMSMEGSFYDDGGDLMGGEDQNADKETGNNIMYQSAITEESETSCSFSPRQESLLRHGQQFAEQQAEREKPREIFQEEEDYEAREDGLGRNNASDDQQIPVSQDSSSAPIHSDFDTMEPQVNTFEQDVPAHDYDRDDAYASDHRAPPVNAFDQQENPFNPFDHNDVNDTYKQQESLNTFEQQEHVNGSADAHDPFNSLLDAPVTEAGLQTPVTESGSSGAFESSSVDVHNSFNQDPMMGRDYESSSVDVDHHANDAAQPINGFGFAPAVNEEITRDVVEKVESAGASTAIVHESVTDDIKEVADTASSQPPAPAAIPEAAAAAAVVAEVKKSTKTTADEKKKPKKAPGTVTSTTTSTAAAKKSTTTSLTKRSTTTAKTGDTTTTTNGTSKSATTTATSAKTTRVSSAASRTSTASATKKTEVSSTTRLRTTSPTKKPTDVKTPATTAEKKTPKTATSPTKAPAKASPLPSYAQPITPRKPREPKPTTEVTKRPATAGSTHSPRPASSTTTPRPRPASSITRTSTTTTSATRTSTTTSSTPRPKSSPTKLPNGSISDRSTSPTKKTGVGATKPTSEKKEVKAPSRIASATRSTGSPATSAARTPQKTTSPRTPSSTGGSAKSRIGSLDNASHTPKGGAVKITTKKVDYSNVTSRVGSKDKMDHRPGGGNVKIETRKVKVEAVKSKVGSLDNASHKPTGGDKKIETKKLEWKVESKIGSLDNARHVAGGGDKKIETQKTEWNVQSKIGTFDNLKHQPGGGDKQIEDHHLDFKNTASPKIGSLDNNRINSNGSDVPIDSNESKANGGSPV